MSNVWPDLCVSTLSSCSSRAQSQWSGSVSLAITRHPTDRRSSHTLQPAPTPQFYKHKAGRYLDLQTGGLVGGAELFVDTRRPPAANTTVPVREVPGHQCSPTILSYWDLWQHLMVRARSAHPTRISRQLPAPPSNSR